MKKDGKHAMGLEIGGSTEEILEEDIIYYGKTSNSYGENQKLFDGKPIYDNLDYNFL